MHQELSFEEWSRAAEMETSWVRYRSASNTVVKMKVIASGAANGQGL